MEFILSALLLVGAVSIGWLKGNSRALFGVQWEPWVYWLFFSLPQTYMGIYGWWGLLKITEGDVWKSMLYSSTIALLTQILLNSIVWGFNFRITVSLSLILIAGIIAK